jgi:hypothetical protein
VLICSQRIIKKTFAFSVKRLYGGGALNYFIGKSQAWLETELAKAQAEYAEGKSLVQASGGDASASKQLAMSLERRIQQILRALYLLDPATYPADSVIPVRQTRASF